MCKKMDLAGVRIDDCNVPQAIQKAEIYLKSGCLNTIETATMSTVVAAGENELVRTCLEQADLVLPGDREILEMAGILSGDRILEVEDRQFFHEFMSLALHEQKTFFLLAQTQEEIDDLKQFLQELYEERVQICGSYALDDCVGDEADVVNEINSISPGIILSSLPTPKQEEFLYHNQDKFNAEVWYGISAEYDLTESRRGLRVWLKKMQCRYKMRQQIQTYENTEE